MPPRVRFTSLTARPLALRLSSQAAPTSRRSLAATLSRSYADGTSKLHPNPNVKTQTDPNAAPQSQQQDQDGRMQEADLDPTANAAPHVSEEAAAMAKVKGEQPPEMSQGTPVTEAVKQDKEFQKNLPKVMQDAISQQQKQQKRKFSTQARRLEQQQSLHASQGAAADMPPPPPPPAGDGQALSLAQLESPEHYEINEATAQAIADELLPEPVRARQEAELRARPGLKFAAPELPLAKGSNMRKDRYDDVVTQVTNLMMRHGKKAQAQRHMAEVLAYLRTAPTPRPNPSVALLPSAPPAHHLPFNPVAYLETAIDSVAPLFRITSLAGAAGGGASLQIPKALQQRQRRRTAIQWLLEASDKRKGGINGFSRRFADEVIAVVEGKSSAWEKRAAVHRVGIGARSNLTNRKFLARR